jgi:hypothetical protein
MRNLLLLQQVVSLVTSQSQIINDPQSQYLATITFGISPLCHSKSNAKNLHVGLANNHDLSLHFFQLNNR